MIIYGIRSTYLDSFRSKRAICPYCSTSNSIFFNYYSRHLHMFWIPIAPFGKYGESQCDHCKQALSYGKMPTEWKEEYKALKKTLKTPFWKYSGIVVVLLVLLYFFITIQLNNS